MKTKSIHQRAYDSADRNCGPNDSRKIEVKRYILKDWYRFGYLQGFRAAQRIARRSNPGKNNGFTS